MEFTIKSPSGRTKIITVESEEDQEILGTYIDHGWTILNRSKISKTVNSTMDPTDILNSFSTPTLDLESIRVNLLKKEVIKLLTTKNFSNDIVVDSKVAEQLWNEFLSKHPIPIEYTAFDIYRECKHYLFPNEYPTADESKAEMQECEEFQRQCDSRELYIKFILIVSMMILGIGSVAIGHLL